MWKDIKHSDMIAIEKVVGEYNIWVLEKSPYGKFKIKICEKSEGGFIGYTNLYVIDEDGKFNRAVGKGDTEEKALRDTLSDYLKLVSRKNRWNEEDFQCVDSVDF